MSLLSVNTVCRSSLVLGSSLLELLILATVCCTDEDSTESWLSNRQPEKKILLDMQSVPKRIWLQQKPKEVDKVKVWMRHYKSWQNPVGYTETMLIVTRIHILTLFWLPVLLTWPGYFGWVSNSIQLCKLHTNGKVTRFLDTIEV